MSVGRPEDFLGHDTQIDPSLPTDSVNVGQASTNAAREVWKATTNLGVPPRLVAHVAPSGSEPSASANPTGASSVANGVPEPIPNFLGSGVPE